MVKRKNKNLIVENLTNIQKFIFAPMAFQAVGAMMDFGMVDFLSKNEASESEIIDALSLNEYIVRTLLQVAIANNFVELSDGKYKLSALGELFLYDDMTISNYNFVRDVCYKGAGELTESFKNAVPIGLKKYIGDYPTIYPALPFLPEKMRNSWYSFDHLYSDNCFDKIFCVISQKYSSIFDIGGNTGKFEKVCLGNNKDIDITMLDLKVNIDKIKNSAELTRCKFHPIDVLDDRPDYPMISNSAVLMSQFLDCFSKEQILKILKDIHDAMDEKSSVYILEPYTDNQRFEAAGYSLVHSSLYFTCMANGVSKFYSLGEMKELVIRSRFKVENCITDIGPFSYTLLECKKA